MAVRDTYIAAHPVNKHMQSDEPWNLKVVKTEEVRIVIYRVSTNLIKQISRRSQQGF